MLSTRVGALTGVAVALAVSAWGCGGDGASRPDDADSDSDSDADSDSDTDTDTDSDSDTDADTDPPVDCDELPLLPLDYTSQPTIGAEDFTFDDEGFLVVVERGSGNLYLQPYGGSPYLFVPNIGTGSSAGTKVLPGGDIVVVDETGPIFRISELGAVSRICQNVAANGLAIGDDGMIYAASYWGSPPGLFRVDPETGESELLHSNTSAGGGGYDGITMATGYGSVFVNEGEWLSNGGGRVFELEFQEDGSVEEVNVITPLAGGSSGTLDSMATDVCGNLYIAVSNLTGDTSGCSGSGAFRVSPEGTTELVACFGNAAFTPSLSFGSGLGGWDATHLFTIDWNGVVYEVDVGVPGKLEPHLMD